MAKFKLGDKVRMDPFISGDHDQYVKFRNKAGTIVGVGTYEYDVTFPEIPGEAYEFYEEELTRVKSLPTTDTKSLRAKYKGFVPTDGQTAWVIWDGESYWSSSGWVEEGSDKALYFRSRASAQEVCDHLRRKGKIGRFAQVIDVKG